MFRKILFIFTIIVITTTAMYASQKSQDNVTELYIATFNRAPDIDGLRYWVKSSSLELEGVAQSFFDQEETKKKYPSEVTEENFIKYVYANLFGRTPDKAGADYWLDELTNNSHIHRSVFILAVINGAKGDDSTLLTNKTTVGLSFANDGRYDLIEAEGVLEGITSDTNSVDEVLNRYNIPKNTEDIGEGSDSGDGSGTLPPAPTNIAELLKSTKQARDKLSNYIPSNTPSYGKEFFVSTTGNDANIGTIDAPLLTLKGAKDAVRAYKNSSSIPSGGIVVWFRAGNYSVIDGVDFTSPDSGKSGKPIAYRAYKNEKVRIMGAVPLNSSWFTSVSSSDPLYSRLDANARANIKVVNLNAHGITNLGKLDEWHYASNTPLELFDDTSSLDIARWPDSGETTKIPYYTDNKMTIYGTGLTPDVSGSYTKETNLGSNDGKDFYTYASFKKDSLVNGKQYYIRHYKAQSDGVRRTWAITDSDYKSASFLFSGTGYSVPRDFWLNSNGSKGIPMSVSFDEIQFGFASMRRGLSQRSFEYIGDRPSRWKDTGDLWVNGMFSYAWRNYHNPLTSINTSKKSITMKYNDPLGMQQKEIKRQYYVYNILEELTTKGEYFIDKDSSNLYYYPKRDLSSSKLFASMNEDYLIKFDGASYIEFHDMAIEMSRQDIIRFTSGSHNLLSHLKLRLSGRHLALFDEKSSSCGVEYSILSGSGERAVKLDGGDLMTLTNGNNFVTNNHIIGDNRWSWTSQGAIGVYGVGNRAEHNDIHGFKHQPINFTSNNCSISYNNIYDVLQYTEDAGAIYSGRNWHHRGNKVNYNFIHDIKNNYSQRILTGIYFDATLSEQEVRGNIFYNIDGKGILQAGGRDNVIENNLFVHIATPFMGMNHGINQYSTKSGDSFNMLERALKYNYKSGIYASTYPKLARIPDNWNSVIGTHWLLPEDNSFRYNAGEDNLRWALNGKIESGTLDFEVYTHAEMTPISMDSSNFKPLPYDKIGIQM